VTRPVSDPSASKGPRRRVVALGGGHGLHASLSALRRLPVDITAVVTVADDGGSSGRIRREFAILPPGDLRMALAALCGSGTEHARWGRLLQHRFGGSGGLAGHPVGNLLLTGLLDDRCDPVEALAAVGALVGAVGRVLPMSPVPLDLTAEVDHLDPDRPSRSRTIRGQSSIASTPGRVRSVRVLPPEAPACAEAVAAVREADVVVLGPGSWFTSVVPHLLLPELRAALVTTSAQIVVTLNLVQSGETEDFSPLDLLQVLRDHAPGLTIDTVVADRNAVVDPDSLHRFATSIAARVVFADLAAHDGTPRHDPVQLATAFEDAFGWGPRGIREPTNEGIQAWR
jgi:uncharacterized cofD-like protein